MGMTEVVHVSAGITIDGKFDDWKNQPVEKWTTDQFTYHDVGFVADDQYVYVYVSMAPKNPGNYKVMQPSGYQIMGDEMLMLAPAVCRMSRSIFVMAAVRLCDDCASAKSSIKTPFFSIFANTRISGISMS